jgi:hypothetical protein
MLGHGDQKAGRLALRWRRMVRWLIRWALATRFGEAAMALMPEDFDLHFDHG